MKKRNIHTVGTEIPHCWNSCNIKIIER